MQIRTALMAGILAATSVLAPSAGAESVTAEMQVRIRILKGCDVSTAAPTDMDFGMHGTLDAAIDHQSTISVTCNPDTRYSVGLDGGKNADIRDRRMTNDTGEVAYQLYSDPERAVIWGDTDGTDTVTNVGTGAPQILTVYGRVPVQQIPSEGTYSDTIRVIVSY